MIQGLNTEVRYHGRLCHVQTEDSGPQNPVLATHIFLGGKIVVSVRSEYREALDRSDMEDYVHHLMLEQHTKVEDDLRAGKYDNEVRGLGSARTDIPLARKKSRSMVSQEGAWSSSFESRSEESMRSQAESSLTGEGGLAGFDAEPSLRSFPPSGFSVSGSMERSGVRSVEKTGFDPIMRANTNSKVTPLPDRPLNQPSAVKSLMPSRTPPPLVRGGAASGRSKPPPLPSDVQRTPAPVRATRGAAAAAILTSSTAWDFSELRASLAVEANQEHFRFAHPGGRLFDPLLLASFFEIDDI